MHDELVVRQPDGSSQRIALSGERLRVGRSTSDNDVSFPKDQSMSRHHLVIEHEGGDWIVEERKDPRPKNPTLVNGSRLDGRHRLRPGDRILAGKIEFLFNPQDGDSSGGVVFYPGQDEEPLRATVMTRLDGILSGEITRPGRVTTPPPGAVADRRLPLEHPAVAAVVRACRELPGHRPLPELFRLILDLSIDAVGAERGVLMSLEGSDLVVRAQRGDEFRISSTVRDRVIGERTSVLVRDARVDDFFRKQESIVAQSIRSMMAVPLQTKDRVLGLIHLDSRSFTQEFSPDDLGLLTVLANIAAIRIEQERLIQIEVTEKLLARDLDQAARIQRRLLPSTAPSIPRFEIAGYNAACRTVGGDYYDFFRYPDGRLGVVIGDVAGKGLPAALLMTSLKGGVQVLAEGPDEVDGLLERLNRVVCANFPPNRFVSLFFCQLDPSDDDIVYCNAGHNPPLLVRRGGAVERLSGGGAILGLDAGMAFHTKRCATEPGDVIVLYSDGVTEATSPDGEDFGEERVAEIVARSSGASAQDLVHEISGQVAAWTRGAPASDDVTLVVVRRSA